MKKDAYLQKEMQNQILYTCNAHKMFQHLKS